MISHDSSYDMLAKPQLKLPQAGLWVNDRGVDSLALAALRPVARSGESNLTRRFNSCSVPPDRWPPSCAPNFGQTP